MGRESKVVWYCCKCSHFWLYDLYTACVNCCHQCCKSCKQQKDGKPRRGTVSRVERQIRPVLQTQHQDATRSLTTNVTDRNIRKVLGAGPFSGSDTSDQTTASPKSTGTNSTQPTILLTWPTHREKEHTTGPEQLQIAGQLPSKPVEQKFDQVLATDSNRSTGVYLLTSPSPSTSVSVATPLLFSKYLTDSVEHWLDSIARAAMRNRPSTASILSFTISDREATNVDEEGGARTLPIKNGISVVSPEGHGAHRRVQTLEIKKRTPEEPCGIPGLKSDSMNLASNARSNAHTTTNQSTAVPDKTYTHQPNVNETPLTLGHVRPHSVNMFASAEDSHFGLLTQTVYSALCFDPSGSLRECGSGQAARRPATSRNSGQTQTTPRKRPLEGGESSLDDDDNNNSGKTKRSRMSNATSDQVQRRFACLHCKYDLSYGDHPGLKCAGWSSPSIDNILRRHLKKHVQCGHASETKYDRVRALMRDYSLLDPQQAEELWVVAYMEVFDIDPQQRYRVPSPYYDSTDLASNINFAAFAARLIERINEDPATAIPLRDFFTANAALNRERNAEMERLRSHFRIQEARFIEENHARREAAMRELDNQYDAQQLRLNMYLESALDSRQQLESENHIMPGEIVGTIPRNFHILTNASGSVSTNASRISYSNLPSGQRLGSLSSTLATMPTWSESNSDSGGARAPATTGVFHDIIPIGPRSMNANDVEAGVFLEVAARQASHSTLATDSHNHPLFDNAAHNHPNDAIEVPNSYSPCGYCNRICAMGQDICDRCTDLLASGPHFLFPS